MTNNMHISNSIFNPKNFIECFASHLALVKLPSLCILSLIPHLDRYITTSDEKQFPYIFKTQYSHFKHPVEYVVFYAGMGAPTAGMSLEIAIELGVEKILIIGTCGLLNSEIQSGDIILPTEFIREEGTSMHYLPSNTSINTNHSFNKNISEHLNSHQIPFHSGLHWTTDAPFRETADKISQYSKKGCYSVDMETSALFSIAQFHQKAIGAILVGSDYLSENEWRPPEPSFRIVANRLKKIFKIAPEILQDL